MLKIVSIFWIPTYLFFFFNLEFKSNGFCVDFEVLSGDYEEFYLLEYN